MERVTFQERIRIGNTDIDLSSYEPTKGLNFVFSGGGIRGSYQAGGVSTFLKNKVIPEKVYGISVGALNAVLVALWAGAARDGDKRGMELWDPANYWRYNVTKKSDLFESKSFMFRIVPGWLRGKFDGLLGFQSLSDKLDEIPWDKVRESPVKISVGTVNMSTGKMTYADPSFFNFKDYVLASCSIPIVFPLVTIGPGKFTDGGICEIAPLNPVIEGGAEDIIMFLCQSEELIAANFNDGDPLQLAFRFMDVVSNSIISADVSKAELYNDLLKAQIKDPRVEGKRIIGLHILRPKNELAVSVSEFGQEDVSQMIAIGEWEAVKYMMRNLSG